MSLLVGAAETVPSAGQIVGVHEVEKRTTDEIVGAITKQPVGRPIREENTPLVVEPTDRVGCVLEEGRKPGLADAQSIVGPLALERVGQGLAHLAQEGDLLVAPLASRSEHADAEIAD